MDLEGDADEDPEQGTLLSQLLSGAVFVVLAAWLLHANSGGLSNIQRATIEKRLTVCCLLASYISLLSAFFNFFQLTTLDDVKMAETSIWLDLARPLEWITTFPLMQLMLVLLGGGKVPDYRRFFMPGLALVMLGCGSAFLLTKNSWRLIWYVASIPATLVMFWFNGKQLAEFSDGTEGFSTGDSDYRRATLVLILTWLPFPVWLAASPEGFGLFDDIVLAHIGWAFLNVATKLSFFGYLQKSRDRHIGSPKMRNDAYGMAVLPEPRPASPDGEEIDIPPANCARAGPPPAKHQLDFSGVVVDTLAAISMGHRSAQLLSRLRDAQVSSVPALESLTAQRCRDLQLPWDVISAMQRHLRAQYGPADPAGTFASEQDRGVNLSEADQGGYWAVRRPVPGGEERIVPSGALLDEPLRSGLPRPGEAEDLTSLVALEAHLSAVQAELQKISARPWPLADIMDKVTDVSASVGALKLSQEQLGSRVEALVCKSQLDTLHAFNSMAEELRKEHARIQENITSSSMMLKAHAEASQLESRAAAEADFSKVMSAVKAVSERLEQLNWKDLGALVNEHLSSHIEVVNMKVDTKIDGIHVALQQQQAGVEANVTKALNELGRVKQNWEEELLGAASRVEAQLQQSLTRQMTEVDHCVRRRLDATENNLSRRVEEVGRLVQGRRIDDLITQAGDRAEAAAESIGSLMKAELLALGTRLGSKVESMHSTQSRQNEESKEALVRRLEETCLPAAERTERALEHVCETLKGDIASSTTRIVTRSDGLDTTSQCRQAEFEKDFHHQLQELNKHVTAYSEQVADRVVKNLRTDMAQEANRSQKMIEHIALVLRNELGTDVVKKLKQKHPWM